MKQEFKQKIFGLIKRQIKTNECLQSITILNFLKANKARNKKLKFIQIVHWIREFKLELLIHWNCDREWKIERFCCIY